MSLLFSALAGSNLLQRVIKYNFPKLSALFLKCLAKNRSTEGWHLNYLHPSSAKGLVHLN